MHYRKILGLICALGPSGYPTKENTVQYKTRRAINAADSPSSGGPQVKTNKEEHTYITNKICYFIRHKLKKNTARKYKNFLFHSTFISKKAR